MRIAILGDDSTKVLFAKKPLPVNVEILWCGSLKTLIATVADVYIDFLFTDDPERMHHYQMRKQAPLFVNAVEYRSASLPSFLIRFNGWQGFFDSSLLEIVTLDSVQAINAEEVFGKLGWQYKAVADLPGMIRARIVATIINEAYYTVGDNISSKEEIDIAMRLGTNYPFGPFEWANQIGLKRVYDLLMKMNREDERISIAPELIKEVHELHNI